VRLRGVDLDCSHLKCDYLQALALNSGNDITDDIAANTVRFDQDKGALRHYYSLRLFYGITHELTGAGDCPGCRLRHGARRSDRGRQTAVGPGSLSHFLASQMPVNQSAVKITPSTYITESRTPDAMTAS
jgi:hypothetical protein